MRTGDDFEKKRRIDRKCLPYDGTFITLCVETSNQPIKKDTIFNKQQTGTKEWDIQVPNRL